MGKPRKEKGGGARAPTAPPSPTDQPEPAAVVDEEPEVDEESPVSEEAPPVDDPAAAEEPPGEDSPVENGEPAPADGTDEEPEPDRAPEPDPCPPPPVLAVELAEAAPAPEATIADVASMVLDALTEHPAARADVLVAVQDASRPPPPPGPHLRHGHVRRRVVENVSAQGWGLDGHAREHWIPGEVGDFRLHVLDSAPHCFADP